MHSLCGALHHLQSRSREELPWCHPDGFSIWAAIVFRGSFLAVKNYLLVPEHSSFFNSYCLASQRFFQGLS